MGSVAEDGFTGKIRIAANIHKDIFIPLKGRYQCRRRQNSRRIDNKVRTLKSALGESAAAGNTCPMSTGKDTLTNASPDPFGLRDGEVAVRLPEGFDASLYFIGRIRTPWVRREDCPKNGREAEAICTIELDSRWLQGLRGLETSSHVVVLYWMDKARRDLVLQAPRHYGERRGTPALRPPGRPPPIGLRGARVRRLHGRSPSLACPR